MMIKDFPKVINGLSCLLSLTEKRAAMLRDRTAIWSSMIKDDVIEEEMEDNKETGSKSFQETKEAASRWIHEENFSGASVMHWSRVSDSVNISLRWMERSCCDSNEL